MKHLKYCVLVLVSAVFAGDLHALEKKPKRQKIREAVVRLYDANGNGTLDEDERARILKTFDANENGKLDGGERMAIARAVAEKQRSQAETHAGGTQVAPETSKWHTVGHSQANTMGGGKADIPSNGVFRVFVLMGQSNMSGAARAAELQAPYNQTHERIRIWANGGWEYFVPSRRFGPGVSMAHQLARFWPEDTIGIIKVASGGTGICGFEKHWRQERAARTSDGKKGPLYKDLMNAVAEAGTNSQPVFSGFVWKQGAADGTRKELADAYYKTFVQLVADLREDLKTPDMPVVVLTYLSDAELAQKDLSGNRRKYIGTVLKAHNRAGRDIPNTTTVHHGMLPLVDAVHFDSEGQVTLGEMTADAVEAFYTTKQ